MHEVDDLLQHAGVELGEHAVAEVEDVAGPAGVAAEHVAGAVGHDVPRRQAHGRVEVALHGLAGHALAGDVERHPPVDADDVGAGVAHQREQLAGADAEVDARHAGGLERGEHLGAVPAARARA